MGKFVECVNVAPAAYAVEAQRFCEALCAREHFDVCSFDSFGVVVLSSACAYEEVSYFEAFDACVKFRVYRV